VTAQGRQRVGEAGAIGSPKIQESKAKEKEEEEGSGLRTGLYVSCGSCAYGPFVTRMPAAYS